MSDTSTKRALEVAKFHKVSEELYADNPEDSGRRAMHHISANLLRDLAAERDALRAERDMLKRDNEIMVGMINDMGTIVINARAALGEKE